jgi:pentatricopeptide repeat protein
VEKLISNGDLTMAEQILNSKVNLHNTVMLTILMKGYLKSRELQKAKNLIHQMYQNKNTYPNIVTFNTYIKCAIDCDRLEEAEMFFQQVEHKDLITYSVFISGLF